MNIEYCDKCGYRVQEEDLVDGTAVRTDDKIFCAKCAPPVKHTSRTRITPAQPKGPRGSGRIPAISDAHSAPPASRHESGRMKTASVDRTASGGIAGPILFLCGALVLAGAGIYVSTGRSSNNKSDGAAPNSSAKTSDRMDTSRQDNQRQDPGNNPPPRKTDKEPTTQTLSMLRQKVSDEEKKASDELQVIVKLTDKAQKIEKLKQFLAKASPDWDISARARATLYTLEKTPTVKPPNKVELKAELVGWWKLNDGKDAVVASDSSGAKFHGKVVGSPVWVTGASGGLQFDNDNDYVELPTNPTLDKLQENDFSMCAWFKADKAPAVESDHAHCGYGILTKVGQHTGLTYYHGGYLSMDLWMVSGARANATASSLFAHGEFYHLAGVVSRTLGENRIYVNGELAGMKKFTPGDTIRAYDGPWRIGIAAPGIEWAWPTKGVIRDARLFKGVLSEAQVEGIYKETK